MNLLEHWEGGTCSQRTLAKEEPKTPPRWMLPFSDGDTWAQIPQVRARLEQPANCSERATSCPKILVTESWITRVKALDTACSTMAYICCVKWKKYIFKYFNLLFASSFILLSQEGYWDELCWWVPFSSSIQHRLQLYALGGGLGGALALSFFIRMSILL